MNLVLVNVRPGQLALVDVSCVRIFPEYINVTKVIDPNLGLTKTVTVRNSSPPSSYISAWYSGALSVNQIQIPRGYGGEYRDLIEIPYGTPLLYLGSFVGSRDTFEAHYGLAAKPVICHRFLYNEKAYVWAAQRLEKSIRKYTDSEWTRIFRESDTLFRSFFRLI